MEETASAALWWAVIASGLYHGVNPGMGWPLAVSSALMQRRAGAMPRALLALGVGHFTAMLLILLPFSAMGFLFSWQWEIRVAAGLLVIGLGVYLLIEKRHPRFLARIPPTKLALWSFLVALAHGAGLMLLPIYLGLCGVGGDASQEAAATLMRSNLETALLVGATHTFAMLAAGAALAAITFYKFGAQFISRAWFNLDTVWAVSLIAVGVFALAASSH